MPSSQTSLGADSAPPRTLYPAVFLVSLSVLMLEVSLVRLFSVLFRYHFVFAIVSFSILGLGIGALLARWRNHPSSLAAAAAVFGLLQVGLLLTLFRSPLLGWFSPLLVVTALLLAPFCLAGWFLASVFFRWSAAAGRLYAADLLGAAAGCLASIGLMNLAGPVNALLCGAAAAALAGAIVAPHGKAARLAVLAAAAVAAVALGWNLARPFADLQKIPLPLDPRTTKPMLAMLRASPPSATILASHWDAYTRTDVVSSPNPHIRLVFTDGDTPTQMFEADSPYGTPEFLRSLIAWVPFEVWPADETRRVLCIGAGGGLDVQLARLGGAADIVAVDINRALPRLMDQFRAYHGDVYGVAGTTLRIAEGRHYLQAGRDSFDLIVLALTQTATAGGHGLALLESYIHTIEAFQTALRRLTPNGRLALVFQEETLLQRAFLTACEALQPLVGPGAPVTDHLAALSKADLRDAPYNHLLLLKRSPLTPAERAALEQAARRQNLLVPFLPGRPGSAEFVETLAHRLGRLNLLPVRDDNPFFFDLSPGIPPPVRPLLGVSAALTALLLAWVGRSGFAGGPGRDAVPLWLGLWVALIGTGFMIVQTVLVQRLVIFLGFPTAALAVVTGAMLAGGACGSLLAQRLAQAARWRGLTLIAAVAIPALLAVNHGLPPLLLSRLADPFPGRIALTALWVGPVGLLMGLFFPSALHLAGRAGRGALIPWLWAVNGTSSVLGGALAVSLAKVMNFGFCLQIATLCYVAATLVLGRLVWRNGRRIEWGGGGAAGGCG